MTVDESGSIPSFVALCPKCGLLLACAVDRPEYAKDNAKAVASWIRSRLLIEKRSVADVRVGEWCKCPREKRKNPQRPATPVQDETEKTS